MARLTLCLIAKDEEAMLPGCLASVEGVADEVVLVDTGSSDRTRELARAAGAKVLERPWDDDFAAPRNLAARAATGDWLLVLDADERLAAGAGPALLAALGRRDFDVGMVRLHNASRAGATAEAILSGEERHGGPVLLPRLVRNAGQPTWRGAIHESVGEWLVARGGKRADLPVDVLHLGYVPSVLVSRNKRERNIGLLRRRCALEPDDVTPRGYLALELLEAGRAEEAWGVTEEAWAMLDRQPPHRDLARIAVARGLLAIRRPEPALALDAVARGEAHNGPHPDFDFLRGFAREIEAVRATPRTPERAAALGEAEAAFRAALGRLATGAAWDFLGAVNEARAGLHLGVVLLLGGKAGEALAALADVLRREPANGAARVGAAEALLDVGEPAKALATVERALGPAPDGWLVAAGAAHALGAGGDARVFLAEAGKRNASGYECVHRWARHRALAAALGLAPA